MKLKHIFYTAAAMAMLSFQACTLDEGIGHLESRRLLPQMFRNASRS